MLLGWLTAVSGRAYFSTCHCDYQEHVLTTRSMSASIMSFFTNNFIVCEGISKFLLCVMDSQFSCVQVRQIFLDSW